MFIFAVTLGTNFNEICIEKYFKKTIQLEHACKTGQILDTVRTFYVLLDGKCIFDNF